ncbi:MAG: hypothetical protein QNJ68_04730 [Microcoleaceae cyanobacterium MO_207.B10]|nr:hypothetical protein [Microcoleaceae cyanobacterium MO_207.B10]
MFIKHSLLKAGLIFCRQIIFATLYFLGVADFWYDLYLLAIALTIK